MKFQLTILLAALTPTIAIGQVTPADPPCFAYPDGAGSVLIDCYDQACEKFTKAWQNCDTSYCKVLAYVDYLGLIDTCDNLAYTPENSLFDLMYAAPLPDGMPAISLPIYALGGNNPLLLSIDLGFEDSEPVPEGVIVLSDGTWYEPPTAD